MFFSGAQTMWSFLKKGILKRLFGDETDTEGVLEAAVNIPSFLQRLSTVRYIRCVKESDWVRWIVFWMSDYLVDGRGEQRERMSHPDKKKKDKERQNQPKRWMTWLSEVKHEEQAPQKLTGRGGKTSPAPPEMKKGAEQSYTCFQFPPNWNSVRNNGRLCETESERKGEWGGKWEPGWYL